MKKILTTCAVVLGLATGAQAERLICQFPEDNRAKGWVAPVMVFDIDPQGRVIVADDIVMHFNEGPMETNVRTNNSRRLTVTWDIDTVDRIGQTALDRYTAFINRRNMTVSILVQPRGYRAFPQVPGQCRQEG